MRIFFDFLNIPSMAGRRKKICVIRGIRVKFSPSFFISHRFHRLHRFNSSDSGGIILVYLNRYGNGFDLSCGVRAGINPAPTVASAIPLWWHRQYPYGSIGNTPTVARFIALALKGIILCHPRNPCEILCALSEAFMLPPLRSSRLCEKITSLIK